MQLCTSKNHRNFIAPAIVPNNKIHNRMQTFQRAGSNQILDIFLFCVMVYPQNAYKFSLLKQLL